MTYRHPCSPTNNRANAGRRVGLATDSENNARLVY